MERFSAMHYAALCLAAILGAMFTLDEARAQSCVTLYSGCSNCSNPSGTDYVCWGPPGEGSPRPFGTGFYGLCRATSNLQFSQTLCEPPQSAGQRNVYRFYSAAQTDHFLTTSWAEGVNAGLIYETVAFKVYSSPQPNSHPLYRCRIGGDHFVSTASNCEGQVYEDLYGYVLSSASSGHSAVHRFYHFPQTDHLSTRDYNEGVAWPATYEGVQGYAPN
jgi:hypothetical protein